MTLRLALALVAVLTLAAMPFVSWSEEPTPAADAAAPAAAPAALFEHDVANYTVRVVPNEAGGLELSVVPKGIYHINVEYPWKFKEGETTYKKDDFKLTEARAALAVPAKAANGELRFSVCSPQTCLIEKVQVAAE